MRRELDLFGVLLLAIAAAVSGGVGRDVLIGAASCFALRVAAIRYRLQLPIARPPRTAEEGDERD